jgi:hypothetical protein
MIREEKEEDSDEYDQEDDDIINKQASVRLIMANYHIESKLDEKRCN